MDPPSPSNSIKTPDPSYVTIISNACSSQLRPFATNLITPGVLHELPVDYSYSTVLLLVALLLVALPLVALLLVPLPLVALPLVALPLVALLLVALPLVALPLVALLLILIALLLV